MWRKGYHISSFKHYHNIMPHKIIRGVTCPFLLVLFFYAIIKERYAYLKCGKVERTLNGGYL